MIVGIGTDLIVVDRFAAALERQPGLGARLLTEQERGLAVESQAARFAAKEALAKALGAPGGLRWLDCEVVRDEARQPHVHCTGTVAERVAELGITRIHLSISHDGGLATAMVVCEA
ncbi:holo-ACP synthase [uncultured Tessaracoccus sp.]|uniref:holo-ACP synthase n=1 Tax=uncultured Tessaracoccus sp. TaxID=905023 RepID=UPI0025F0136E|nr:holo-ACP synthase [uncultured Tessaracoccus sp.]